MTTMKSSSVSFSINSKSSSSRKPPQPTPNRFATESRPESQPAKEFVTEFDPSKSLQNSQSKTLVIPPISNEWKAHKRMRNLDLPIQASENPNDFQFETDPHSEKPSLGNPNDMSYGLNLRSSTNNNTASSQNQEYESIDRLMVKRFKQDLDRLPDHLGKEEFDAVPVEEFAAALLTGYGWHEGRGIGRNHEKDVKIVEYERRVGKGGIGFVAAPFSNTSNGDTKAAHEEKVKSGYFVSKDVRIVGGREMGLKGRVLEVMGGGDYVVLKVLESGKEFEVKVRGRDVADLGSVEEERCLKKLKELKIKDQNKDSKRVQGDQREEKSVRKERVSWLVSNIRVRIISKKFKGGRLYLRKGTVVDVVGPTTCDICMDDGRELIQGVDQKVLETALPHSGGPVLVLSGKYKGAYGKLVEKDMEKETAVVKDADTHKMLHVLLEQIAEYTGDPSDIGY